MEKIIKRLFEIAEKKEIEVVERANGHYQLKGPLLVNYYPLSAKKTAYIAGTTGGKKGVDPVEAVAMCFKAPKLSGRKDKRSSNSKRKRERLFAKGIKNCHWCGIPITVENSTLEHIIPLHRGGLDNANNRTLACEKCNNERGHDMPELAINKKTKLQ